MLFPPTPFTSIIHSECFAELAPSKWRFEISGTGSFLVSYQKDLLLLFCSHFSLSHSFFFQILQSTTLVAGSPTVHHSLFFLPLLLCSLNVYNLFFFSCSFAQCMQFGSSVIVRPSKRCLLKRIFATQCSDEKIALVLFSFILSQLFLSI